MSAVDQKDDLAAPALAWLLGDGYDSRFVEQIHAGTCNQLRNAGVPLDRATLHSKALHPQFAAVGFSWRPGKDESELRRLGFDVFAQPGFLNSPVRAVFDGAGSVRARLTRDGDPDEPTIFTDLRKEGFTDYVALPLVLSDGKVVVSTWATQREGGWTTEFLMAIDRVRPLLAMAVEIRLSRRISKNIAEAYLGARTSERVLNGQITRGTGESMEAAIWILDMREFTAMTERTPVDQVIERLNLFFETFGEPVREHGGEILKFMGDAMLAIFTPESGENAACRAVDAALVGMNALDAINEDFRAAGKEQIDCGLGLHWGDVSYGNIGTPWRLDFTIIGPSVNQTSRIQTLCRTLGYRVLCSEQFAQRCKRPLVPLGKHGVRSLPEAFELFTLKDLVD